MSTNHDELTNVYQAYWIISGVMGGAIYFQEIRSFSPFQACMFVAGILTTIAGVALLAQRSISGPAPPKKRKSLAERQLSSYWHDKRKSAKTHKPKEDVILESPICETKIHTIVDEAQVKDQTDSEIEPSTATENEDSESDENENGPPTTTTSSTDQVNRQAIDNYIDMSPRMCVGTLLGGLGYHSQRNLGIFLRREANRNNRLDKHAQCYLYIYCHTKCIT